MFAEGQYKHKNKVHDILLKWPVTLIAHLEVRMTYIRDSTSEGNDSVSASIDKKLAFTSSPDNRSRASIIAEQVSQLWVCVCVCEYLWRSVHLRALTVEVSPFLHHKYSRPCISHRHADFEDSMRHIQTHHLVPIECHMTSKHFVLVIKPYPPLQLLARECCNPSYEQLCLRWVHRDESIVYAGGLRWSVRVWWCESVMVWMISSSPLVFQTPAKIDFCFHWCSNIGSISVCVCTEHVYMHDPMRECACMWSQETGTHTLVTFWPVSYSSSVFMCIT